ncbi:unnamed protein product [Brachionus calyciflorus]|uniref:Uncharacterized protein n=1 Tax=Brachionus calyciflorus TaxID=104777 RepID=A0A814PRT7_9BILA|nr:unnamed protein product [Brachionus calyciflorus]
MARRQSDSTDRSQEICYLQESVNGIKMEPVFDGKLGEFINNLGARHAICKEFMICPLLTSVAHLMKKSSVCSLVTLTEPSIFYSVLVANPSSGKSTALSIFKKSIYEIESYLKIPRVKSNLINGIIIN